MTPAAFRVDLTCCRRPRDGAPFTLEARFAAGPGVTVVCGASGAGKSTLLLAMLGALHPAGGRVEIAGRVVFDAEAHVNLPVRRRRLGVVLQDALLFPHLDAAGNVAFALHGPRRRARAGAWLERVGAAELASRRADELSGGQRQRVALARALAAEPVAMLLDEPFSALDPGSRTGLGELVAELQVSTGLPFLHVTHDLGEALRLGQHLVLLDAGRVVQQGPPAEVLARPATLAAARAVGTENLLRATVDRHDPDEGSTEVIASGTRLVTAKIDRPPGSVVTLGLRAEEVLVSLSAAADTSARNVLPGTIERLERRPGFVELLVATPAPLRVLVTAASARTLGLEAGREVFLLIKATAFHVVI